MIPSRSGQGALEYLLLIGGAVLVATIILLIVISSTGSTGGYINQSLLEYQQITDATLPFLASTQDIEYGSLSIQKFDFYQPEQNGITSFPGPHPLVVYVHGGCFLGGNEDDIKIRGFDIPIESFLEHGYSFASVQYRTTLPANDPRYPGAIPTENAYYPTQTSDVARAIQHIRAHASEYNIQPNALIIFGNSAGSSHSGNLVFGADYQNLGSPDPVVHESSRPNVYLNYQGQTDFLSYDPGYPLCAQYFGDADNYGLANQSELRAFSMVHLLQDNYSPGACPSIPVFSFYPTGDTTAPVGFPGSNDVEYTHSPYFGQTLQNTLSTYCGFPPSMNHFVSPFLTAPGQAGLDDFFESQIIPWLEVVAPAN